MSKPFFFRIESADLLNFATDPEGEGMSLLRFAKELQKGESEIEFIQAIIDETVEFSQKKRDAAKSRWGAKHEPTTTRSKRLAAAREKGTHTKEEWLEMAAFFNQTCVKCEGEKQIGDIVKDHIIPIYQGGSDSISNLQPLCNSCNSSKGSDSTDHRLGKRLHNACKMPAQWLQTSTSSSTEAEAVTETIKPKPLKKAENLPLPDFITESTWDEFKKMRVGLKKKMTPAAEKRMIVKLTKANEAGHDVETMLDQSILNSWSDVYEPKQGRAEKPTRKRKPMLGYD